MLFFTCLKLSRFVYFRQDYFLFKKYCEMEGNGGDGRDGRRWEEIFDIYRFNVNEVCYFGKLEGDFVGLLLFCRFDVLIMMLRVIIFS